MKCPRGYPLADPELAQPAGQFPRRLAGEGERQGPGRVRRAGGDPVGDPAGQDSGLARPGTRKDAQRERFTDDGRTLGPVEPTQKPLGPGWNHMRGIRHGNRVRQGV